MQKLAKKVNLDEQKAMVDITIDDGYVLAVKTNWIRQKGKERGGLATRWLRGVFQSEEKRQRKMQRHLFYVSMKRRPSAKELLMALLHASYLQKYIDEYT